MTAAIATIAASLIDYSDLLDWLAITFDLVH